MKYILSFLLLASFSSCKASENQTDQSNVKEDTVLLISGESRTNGCSRKCIRISNVNVQLDDCYDQDTELFEKDCEADLTEKTIYKTLLSTRALSWEELEEEIDENHDMNAGLPFIVTLKTKGETKSFILLGVDSLQDKENEALMNQLKYLFDNWEDCAE
ncbi:MAG: hypothetical protein A3D31_11565 [Candidatus Fluviicola riflensis]|nr:MAG: hypothetical protein CHH17_15995 [Candidatus Fluviicola riflensis]OGS77627.1 MAG: hypothetical protein A3D31_11565 [Candidatus Fluviicola riflensis]OGS84693.1 MAG: hypothetical protein A2724_08500 [Fluviicola sp. RIFCSPHIGHO2_01_FULL_43_53]